MRRFLGLLAVLLVTATLAGCGNENKDRGLYRDQDKPQSAGDAKDK